jgi:peptide/nickel transport system permease protein
MKRILVYFIKRVVLYALIFFISVSVFFFVVMLAPGDPITRYIQEMSGRYGYVIESTNHMIEEFKAQFGLDKPLGPRYLAYMKQLFLEGNFGPSLVGFPTPAQELIWNALPWSIVLLGLTVVLSWVLGMILGTFVGWKRGTIVDSAITPIALVAARVPTYLVALILAMTLIYGARMFPSGGAYSALVTKGFNLRFIGSAIYYAILPALSVILVSVSSWMLSQRALVINILGEDYMRFAEAKGLRKGRLINRYILRNTLLPQATGLALSLGFVVNGFFLIEWIYRYPGIGKLFVSAIRERDYNVMLGVTIISMALVLIANLIIELVYPLIDPRIRRGG